MHVETFHRQDPADRRTYWEVLHFKIFGPGPGLMHRETFRNRRAAEEYINLCPPDQVEYAQIHAGYSADCITDLVAVYRTTPPDRETWASSVRRAGPPHSPYRSNGEIDD